MTNTNEAIKTVELTEAEVKLAHEKAIRDKNNKEMKAAKKIVTTFQDTPEYKKLPKAIQEALKRICGKVRVGGVGGASPIADKVAELFKTVGTPVSELDLFKATKMGRGEMRKRVREALKGSVPAERRWIEFDEDSESWTLLSVGAIQPKGFKGKAIVDPK